MSGLVYPVLRFTSFRPLYRFLQGPPRHSSGVPTITEATSSASADSVPAPVDRIRQRNFDILFESLERIGNPSRVWANYTNLLTFLGYERLPLEIHQEVLRKCTPNSRLLRAAATRRIFAGNIPRVPHIYEGRFQAVVRNMRASGGQPTLDDFHFILEQFAAVGHHFGVMQIYLELTTLGIVPRTKTFGLCLQAIAHRLTLPVAPRDRPRRIAVTRRMVSDIVNAMKIYNIPFTSVNLDLTMRILKETTDMQGFETLMKWGYGIDLRNPDCPPLEYLTSASGTDTQRTPKPQPFSTAALNMTIDTLGRLGDISRMVQAFEVLTTPLPRYSPNARSCDEDDDDDFGVPPEPTLAFTPPFANPNTTTYNILMRHVCRAGHAVLARHYLLQAMELDKKVMLDLKNQIGHMPLREVPAPHFAINRGTLLSVFHDSSHDKNLGLMRWLHSKFPRILRKKRGELKYFTQFRHARERKGFWPYGDVDPKAPEFPPGFRYVPNPIPTPPPLPPPIKLPRSPRAQLKASRFTTLMARWKVPKGVNAVFDAEADYDSISSASPIKTFDVELHIRLLTRDISEIEALYAHVDTILSRTTQYPSADLDGGKGQNHSCSHGVTPQIRKRQNAAFDPTAQNPHPLGQRECKRRGDGVHPFTDRSMFLKLKRAAVPLRSARGTNDGVQQ
ncbi:hypothetical protein DFH07DRAFT_964454 [Mycena maculata]|uniref:Uncharacterized protein n=1 Tax=Mycena maculata TaxID=230809 RepID=A0AAD7N1J6_9AGAR|nr:hypothetical protein DFH07DRAFT_964454 [Mycena maculata]